VSRDATITGSVSLWEKAGVRGNAVKYFEESPKLRVNANEATAKAVAPSVTGSLSLWERAGVRVAQQQ
jgi:hypothetical protein